MGKSETDVLLRAHIEIFLIRDYPKVKDTWVPIADLIQALKDKNVCQKREYLTHKVVMAALEQIDFVQLNENKTKIRKRNEEKDSQISQKSQKGKTGKSTKGGSKSGKPSIKPQSTRSSPVKSKQGESAKTKKQPEPIGTPKTRRSEATKTKQQSEAVKQQSKKACEDSPAPARRGKKDLRRTVFAFGLKPTVTEIDLMTICVEHGQVKGIYFEGHEDGPERPVAEIIITKSIKKAQGGKKPSPENLSNLRTVFIVFASQGQATKLVKARGRNASIDGPLDFRCIHKYDYLRVAKRNGLGMFDNVSLTSTPGFVPGVGKPACPRFPSLPGPMVVNTPKNGTSAWDQRKFMCKRPRSAPGPRPYSTKVGIARELASPSSSKRWKMRSPRIDEGIPLNCKMEPLTLQNMKFLHRSPPVRSFGGRFLSLSRTGNDTGLPRRSPTCSSSSFASRHSFGNLDVAKGPPDLHTAGFFWMRNPLYHEQPSYNSEARQQQQPAKEMLPVVQDPPAMGAEASLQINSKMGPAGNVTQQYSGADWDPSFAAPMDPATIMTALDLMPLNFKTPSPTPPPTNQN